MKQGDVVQDRYILEDLLGSGGMAEVWRAHDSRLERPVAIKVMSPRFTDDPEFLIRFFAEAQSVANISHPNVVQVWDFGELDGRSFLVMELLEGGTLRDRTSRPLDPQETLSLVAAVARGAGAAHENGLVHRDIKPANILLSDDGAPKLADFGISASLHSERLTSTGTAIGSPQYVPPEQVSAGDVTPASDVYSLGVLLYELLTGRLPFEEENVTALAIAHVERIPAPPSAHRPELSSQIDDLVMTCLQKDSKSRFEDGNALSRAIERLVHEGATPAVMASTTAVVERVIADDETPAAASRVPFSGASRLLWGVAAVGLVLVIAALVWFNSNPRSGDRARAETQVQSGSRSPTTNESPTEKSLAVASSPSPAPSPTATDRSGPSKLRSGPSGSGSSGRPAPSPSPTPQASPSPTAQASPSPSP